MLLIGIEPMIFPLLKERFTTKPQEQKVGHTGNRTQVSGFKVLCDCQLHYTTDIRLYNIAYIYVFYSLSTYFLKIYLTQIFYFNV